ncbi:MAG: protoheme IX farnesyltransferase [Chitinophagaceae bacterium]|nr:MAG: protoheme IX farnesyltransferase [Chitinophagaceae bacterium]
MKESTKELSLELAIQFVYQRLMDYTMMTKMRLTSSVVLSSIIGYLFAGGSFSFQIVWFIIAGFLVTASANSINQILEKDLDRLMNRTKNRPLPTGRLSVPESTLFAGLTGVAGLTLLYVLFSPLAGMLGALSLFSYAFIYTPLKRLTPFAVFVGAIPGALPPLIGWAAVSGELTIVAWTLFFIQFVWQMPHFWAIAWVADEDYKKAGFNLLPTTEGKGISTAIMILIYNVFLLLISILPIILFNLNLFFIIPIVICNIFFVKQAIDLYKKPEDALAKKLMFGSFGYLPVVMLLLYFSSIL